jgi:hypothetical protein
VSDRERLAALLNAELDIDGSDWSVDYQATADALLRAGVSLTGSGPTSVEGSPIDRDGQPRPAGPWTGDPADYDGDEGR